MFDVIILKVSINTFYPILDIFSPIDHIPLTSKVKNITYFSNIKPRHQSTMNLIVVPFSFSVVALAALIPHDTNQTDALIYTTFVAL
jgi:hypothetical protein